MINEIANYTIGKVPVIGILGVITFLSLIATALIGYLNHSKGIHIISMVWHFRLAKATIVLAIIHIIFALSNYIGY